MTNPAIPTMKSSHGLEHARPERRDETRQAQAPDLRLVRATSRRRHDVLKRPDHRRECQHEYSDRDDERSRGHGRRRDAAIQTPSPQRVRRRFEGRGQHRGEHDREEHRWHGRDRGDPDKQHDHDDQGSPAPLRQPVQPDRHGAGRVWGVRFDVQSADDGPARRHHESDDREGCDEPEEPGEGGADGERDQDQRRMDVDRPRVDQWRHEPALDHLRDRHQHEQDHDIAQAVRRPGHQDEHGRGQDRPDVRDEAPEQDDDRQGTGERHAQDRQEHEVGQRISGRGDGGTTDIPAHQLQGVAAAGRQGVTPPPTGAADGPLPGLLPVLEQEERQESGQECHRDDARHGTDGGCDGPGNPVVDATRDLVDRRDDLVRHGDVGQRRSEGRQARVDRCQHISDGRDDGQDHQDDSAADDRHCCHTDGRGGLGGRPAASAKGGDIGLESRGNDDGDHDRRRDRRQRAGQGQQDQAEGQDDQEPPAHGRQAVEPPRDQGATGRGGSIGHRTNRIGRHVTARCMQHRGSPGADRMTGAGTVGRLSRPVPVP